MISLMTTLNLPSDSLFERILVVDDTADNLFLIQTVLQAEGYEVDVALNGKDALSQISIKTPDLLLLDVMMPGMHGYEVVQRIRENTNLPFIPIILITGCEQSGMSEEFDLPTEGFISKPIEFDDLLNQVSSILSMKDARRLAS